MVAASLSLIGANAPAASAEDLDRDAAQALQTLYKTNPTAEVIAKPAKGILVFPKVIKAGLVFGGSYGEGVLMKAGRVSEYCNSVSASWGWQAGAELPAAAPRPSAHARPSVRSRTDWPSVLV